MSDTYQAIYDAVRSRISGGNVSEVLRSAAHEALDFSHARALLQEQIGIVGQEMARPSVLFKPSLAVDGTKWCALYGSDLQVGVAGFGDTPEEAMRAFDQAWWKENTPAAVRQIRAIHDEERQQEIAANGPFSVRRVTETNAA